MEQSSQKLSLNILKLIQPDLLSLEELVHILQERSVPSNLLSQSKDKLVALFKNVVLPLPQREHRQNYRGCLLTKLRKKLERSKVVINPEDDNKSYTVGVNETVSSIRRSSEQKSDRLRPPPELTNRPSENKKIRLNTISRAAEDRTDLDKIVIKKRKSSESNGSSADSNICVNSDNSDLDRVSAKSEDSNDVCNGSKNSAPKKILLKRTRLPSMSSNVSTTESTSENSPSEPDKKRKPITWP